MIKLPVYDHQEEAARRLVEESRVSRLATRNLNFYYNSFQALHEITVEIPANRITAFIGPSGCGKTTLLRCFNRMNDEIPGSRHTGEVLLDGHDIYARGVDPVDLRRRVGMVFQRPNPFPMSIFDNVAYGPRIHGERKLSRLREIVEKSLRQAALWDDVKDRLGKNALELSGGQQQRLCIARTLAVEPEVILMDEPCSALDPTATFRIEELMVELAERYTLVINTHNLQQAARVAHYTGFLLSGRLIEFSETERMFTQPSDQRTEDYVRGRFG